MFSLSMILCFVLGGGILHLLIKSLAFEKVSDYLFQTEVLLKEKRYTDGCSSPFKTYIHRWMSYSRTLCAAHDYGNLGFITDVRPGWHNNLTTWFAHMSQSNPVYWVWGTVVATITLPWSVWRRNWNISILDVGPFHGMVFLTGMLFWAFYYSVNYQ